jgi:hypothetical protein
MRENSFGEWIVDSDPYSAQGVFFLSRAEAAGGEMTRHHLEMERAVEPGVTCTRNTRTRRRVEV